MELYDRLFAYKFQDNTKFVEGWKKVQHVIPQDKIYESLIKAQVFFYSREIEDVNLTGYMQWLNNNDKVVSYTDTNEDLQQDLSAASENSDPSVRKCVTTETDNQSSDNVGKHPANFAELIYMIQNGIKLPDTEDLNIEPTNEEPSPCQLPRPRKPWEVVS